MLRAMQREIELQQAYLEGEPLETIYFGGGTPSLLSVDELTDLLGSIRNLFTVSSNAEISLEANPDDLSTKKLEGFRRAGVNRLSIGIQSFHDSLLTGLNRVHTSAAAHRCIQDARTAGFQNISIDLIYAIPGETEAMWREDILHALLLKPEHLSCYALTIEPKTTFGKWTQQGRMKSTSDEVAALHLEVLMCALEEAGYEHYEISNFAKPGFYSRHNSSYWKGSPYLGIGPSAHSYNKETRHFTVANNYHYLQALAKGVVPFEKEVLTPEDKINEYLLTTLRTSWGCDCSELLQTFGYDLLHEQKAYLQPLFDTAFAVLENNKITLTKKGKLVADKIASDLFILP